EIAETCRDFGARPLSTATRQLVDRPVGTTSAHPEPGDPSGALGQKTHQVCTDCLDIPPRAEARSRQLRLVEIVDQIGDAATLQRCRGTDSVAVHAYGVKTIDPTVLRPCKSRCAAAASARG